MRRTPLIGQLAGILVGCVRMSLLVVAVATPAPSAVPADSTSRAWEILYQATVRSIPNGARSVRVWVPLPRDGDGQSISDLTVSAPVPYRRVTDSEYGNAALLFEAEGNLPDSLPITVAFRACRAETGARPPSDTGAVFARQRQRFLAPDELVPIDGEIAELALQVVTGDTSDRSKAKAIYDYILGTMRYDKSGFGWGTGDALFACSEHRGNCTDIHSLLIGMARATGIPARFVIGLPIPPESDEGLIDGYHCWADVYLEGIGWVPVDASEAIKNQELSGYYFGTLDPNRLAFTVGRDIKLGGDRAAPTINYFIYPIVQIDGREYTDVSRHITFKAVHAAPGAEPDPTN
jgi:transglutaminase-like putative cysteine protease